MSENRFVTDPQLTPQKPFLLSQADIDRVHRLVHQYLPPGFDHEYIADTIVLSAWLKDVAHISQQYIHQKCISAWRKRESELRRNQAFTTGVKASMIQPSSPNTNPFPVSIEGSVSTERPEQELVNRKILVQEAVGHLTPFERKLIWMRFYDDQQLEEIARMVKLRREQVQQALKVALYKMRVHLT